MQKTLGLTKSSTGDRERAEGPSPHVGHLCFLIARDMRTALDRALSGLNLRAQPAAVLVHICRQRGATPSGLASAVGTDTAGITGLIDQLEKASLVVRRTDPSDRRSTIISATATGRRLLPEIGRVFRAHHAQLLSGFSEEEASMLEGLLKRMRDNAAEELKRGIAD